MSTEWIADVVDALPRFVEAMKDSEVPGRFKYSMTGDIAADPHQWGLGNAVFGVKTAYMLDRVDLLDKETSDYILSFSGKDGAISDQVVHRRSRLHRLYSTIVSGNVGNLFGHANHRAETRQAWAALTAMQCRPKYPYTDIPQTSQEIVSYVDSLDWNQPWAAGSHVSHLAFFLTRNSEFFAESYSESSALLDVLFSEVGKYRLADGSWGKKDGGLSSHQKVNGCMKICTAYEAAGRQLDHEGDALLRLCLEAIHADHACNNLNIVYLLSTCLKASGERTEEVRQFCLERLELYKQHWWPEYGGFSFLPRQANRRYYGAVVSQGQPEPDIHGTHLFLWGLCLITEILGISDQYQLQRPIT